MTCPRALLPHQCAYLRPVRSLHPPWLCPPPGRRPQTICRIVVDPKKFEGKRVVTFGTQDYLYAELADVVYEITQQDPKLWKIPGEVKYSSKT